MKYQARELLVIGKVAQHWQEDFDQKVDELMSIVSKVDNERSIQDSAEIMDVYNKTDDHRSAKNKRRKPVRDDRPFEFLVFRN